MDILTFSKLLTSEGQVVLSAAMALEPREADFLTHFQALCTEFPRDLARAGLEIAILRYEGVKKFPAALQMYFTRAALQQASSLPVSSYRSMHYTKFKRVYEMGCSIGGDTLSLAKVTHTVGIDLDPLRIRMAQANLSALGLETDFIQADITAKLPLNQHPTSKNAIFFDPSRRSQNQRLFSVKDYKPPLSIIKVWQSVIPNIGVKISPGVKLGELSEYDAEIEFLSYQGGLKEAVLWFGDLKSVKRRATLLPGPHTMVSGTPPYPDCDLSVPLYYLYEPDPAILRAGLVRDLAITLSAFQLDPDIAYLTSDKKMTTPFARVWEIEAWLPFQLKKLRAFLRERGVGKVVVKKRGSPIQPESLIRDLRLNGDAERIVFLTHLSGKPIVVIGYPMIK
jgi:hypothetical protein